MMPKPPSIKVRSCWIFGFSLFRSNNRGYFPNPGWAFPTVPKPGWRGRTKGKVKSCPQHARNTKSFGKPYAAKRFDRLRSSRKLDCNGMPWGSRAFLRSLG